MKGVNLGHREAFADLGQTVADNFGIKAQEYGKSFLDLIEIK